MTELAKAVCKLQEGSIEVEGSQSFVKDCLNKIVDQRPNTSELLLEQGLDHAWEWFSLHANQRMQAVNFFLVAAAFLSGAYVSAIHYGEPVVAIFVAAMGASFSLFFNRLEARVRELVKTGEHAMRPAERKLVEGTGIAEFAICDIVENPSIRFTKYSTVINYLHRITGAGFVLGVVYAANRKWGVISGSTPDRYVVVAAIQHVSLAITSTIVMYLAKNMLNADKTHASRLNYVLGSVFGVVGIVAFVAAASRLL